jgi:hypothetical protein
MSSNGESFSQDESRSRRFWVEQGVQLLLTLLSYALFTIGGLAVYVYSRASGESVSVYPGITVAPLTLAVAGTALMLLGVGLGFWNYRRVRRRSKAKRMRRRRGRG